MKTLIQKTLTFLEMIKIEHSIFALPFAYFGLFLAERGFPDLKLFALVTLAMVSFRTVAMALNRLIDRHIDAKNPRTADRALPAGKLKVPFVWSLTGIFGFVFLWTCYALGPLCLWLSPVPIALAYLYPWAKRFTWFSHFVLGIILGIAPYAAWIAARGTFSWVPGFLMLGVTLWVAGFDIIYAFQDEAFDREARLCSIPARFGISASLWLTRFLHASTVVCWFVVGVLADLGAAYFAGLGLCTLFLLREHWLILKFGLEKIQQAFFTMNAVISVTAFVALVIDLMI